MHLKKCRTVNGLVKAINRGEKATLVVWGILPNNFDKEGVYLNLGSGKFSYVGKENWKIIKGYIRKPNGESYSNERSLHPII